MKLLNPNTGELDAALAEYRFFIDQHCRWVDIKLLRSLLSLVYLGFCDDTIFWIQDDQLNCETISKFKIIFPLQK